MCCKKYYGKGKREKRKAKKGKGKRENGIRKREKGKGKGKREKKWKKEKEKSKSEKRRKKKHVLSFLPDNFKSQNGAPNVQTDQKEAGHPQKGNWTTEKSKNQKNQKSGRKKNPYQPFSPTTSKVETELQTFKLINKRPTVHRRRRAEKVAGLS
jgi:hypothetical protein